MFETDSNAGSPQDGSRDVADFVTMLYEPQSENHGSWADQGAMVYLMEYKYAYVCESGECKYLELQLISFQKYRTMSTDLMFPYKGNNINTTFSQTAKKEKTAAFPTILPRQRKLDMSDEDMLDMSNEDMLDMLDEDIDLTNRRTR